MAISIPISVSTYPSLVTSKRTQRWFGCQFELSSLEFLCRLFLQSHLQPYEQKQFHVHGQSTGALRIEMYNKYHADCYTEKRETMEVRFLFCILISLFIRIVTEIQSRQNYFAMQRKEHGTHTTRGTIQWHLRY